MLVASAFVGSITGTLSWYVYYVRATLSFRGTSVTDAEQIQIGLESPTYEDQGETKYYQIALGQRDDDNQVPDIAPEDELLELAYSPGNRSAFELVDMTAEKRFIYENNKVRFAFAKEGETPEQLAKAFGVKLKKFNEYNLLKHPDEMVFHSGDVVYLGKLRNSNWKARKHIVEEGETLRDIALRFAVKPNKILAKNGLKEGDRISKGQELWLR